jgi:hypothetical protein
MQAQTNPGPLVFQDFEPPEAMTGGRAGSKNPGPLIFQDFEPPEAMTGGRAGSKKSGPIIFRISNRRRP